jgi:hypothetical protein
MRVIAVAAGAGVAQLDRGNVYFDIRYYAEWAVGVLNGSRIPYADFAWEYPPLALPAMLGPAIGAELLGGGTAAHTVSWVACALLLDAAVLAVVLRRVAERSLREPAVALWVFGPPLLGAVSWARFDLFPAIAGFAAVLTAAAGSTARSGVAAGVGAALKIWPLLLAPIQRTRPAALRATAVSVGVVGAVAVTTFAVTGSTGFAQVLQYQRVRGLQIESVVALPLLWLRALGADGYQPVFDFGAWQISGPGSEFLAVLSTAVFAASLAVIGVRHWLAMRHDVGPAGVGLTAAVVLLASLLTNKVFSPQYVLWLLAIVVAAAVLDPDDWRGLVPAILGVAALTQLVFPILYGDVIYGAWFGLLILTARDLVLIGIAVVVARRWWRRTAAPVRIGT